jgi:hypothetical protein
MIMERGNGRLAPGAWSPAHPNEGDNERWKGSPSTETTGDKGTNKQTTEDHGRDENVPPSDDETPRNPGSRRPTRH